MGVLVMGQSLTIAGAVTDNPLKFLPVNGTEVVMSSRVVPFQVGIRHHQTDRLGLLLA